MSMYGDVHRRFLQSFVYHPVKTEEEALNAYKLSCEEQGQAISSLEQTINRVNAELRKYTHLEIKCTLCELTGKTFYIAVSTAENIKWGKNVSPYSKNEQTLFRRIVDDLIRDDNGCVSSISCLNYSAQTGMTKSDINASVMKFVKDGWFANKEGVLHMGVRGAAELEPFFLTNYKDMLNHCPLCKRLVFWGHKCGSCPETSHIHCLRKFFASTGVHTACPNCETEWENWDADYCEDEDSDFS